MPSAWFVTLLPTILAAVAFWASFKFVAKRWPSLMRSRHRFVRTAALLGVVSSILGWEVSIVWWSAARGQVIFGTSLFASIIIAPTGFVLGALLGWWYFRMRPNTTQQADAPPAGGAPLS
jgi:hypothetical protein